MKTLIAIVLFLLCSSAYSQSAAERVATVNTALTALRVAVVNAPNVSVDDALYIHTVADLAQKHNDSALAQWSTQAKVNAQELHIAELLTAELMAHTKAMGIAVNLPPQ